MFPNISGYFSIGNGGNPLSVRSASGVFYGSSSAPASGASEGDSKNTRFNFDASRSNGLYGDSSSVQPPASQVLIIIKI